MTSRRPVRFNYWPPWSPSGCWNARPKTRINVVMKEVFNTAIDDLTRQAGLAA